MRISGVFFPLRELVSAAGALRAVLFHLEMREREREMLRLALIKSCKGY